MAKSKISPLVNSVLVKQISAHKRTKVFRVIYDDPFMGKERSRIHSESTTLSDAANTHYRQMGRAPGRKSKVEWDNPATAHFFDKKTHPAIHHWRVKQVPTAAALFPLQRPDIKQLTDGTLISAPEHEWFLHSLDGIGLRSRAASMKYILKEEVRRHKEKNLKWLSLASGASIPILEAAHEVQSVAPKLQITSVDFDKKALKLSRSISRQFGVANFRTIRANILDSKMLKKLLGKTQADVVEILGLFEYLKPDDWIFRYHKVVVRGSKKLAGAKTFLNLAYSFVKPGGILIFGNMLTSHPHLDFTLNVVQWPHIQPRTTREVIDIIEQAGLEGEYKLEIYLPDDGVYAVYVLRKMR